ncbi:hypothetical protein AB1Y20_022691 [Prymnesium parvum]|uniref:VTT domain-containing protein n=1 Tax=Prymnesium parvum TaxID=97485 RepID=A0AB34JKC0_PRYPA
MSSPPPHLRCHRLLFPVALLALFARQSDAASGPCIDQRTREIPSPPFASRSLAASTPRRQQRPVLLAALSRKQSEARAEDLAAAAWVGGLALASEVMQFVNTAAVVFAFQRLTGATSALHMVDALTDVFSRLGYGAYPTYALLLICISVLPLMSALLFIFVAGMLFGPVKGTLLVSLSLSTSAIIAYSIAKFLAAKKSFSLETLSPRAARIDAAIATRPIQTKLLLMTLLRLSPVMPFTFSNYLSGLSSISPVVIFLGTLMGTLPTQLVYVTAGKLVLQCSLGRQALAGGLSMPPVIYIAGGLATVGAIVMVSQIASSVSQKAIGDLESEKSAAGLFDA